MTPMLQPPPPPPRAGIENVCICPALEKHEVTQLFDRLLIEFNNKEAATGFINGEELASFSMSCACPTNCTEGM